LEGVVVNTDFWDSKRVLVTGHTGFKGAWLTLWLEQLGARVSGFSLDIPTTPSLFEQAGLQERIVDVRDDLRNLAAFQQMMDEVRPELVFHLAAQSLVRPSYDDPVGTFSSNVMGTVHLLEAVRQTPSVRSVVIVTSDKCYENQEWIWPYRENDPMGGYDPYSSSKGCAELATSAYRNSFFKQPGAPAVASVRAGNVIGGGDWAADRLVPDVMRALMAHKTPVLRNPSAVRPWQHVLEPLAGYLQLAERLFDNGSSEYAGAWNFGPDTRDVRTVREVVEQLISQWDASMDSWCLEEGTQPHEAHLLKLDSSKAVSLLNWEPKLSLEDAIEWTLKWYRSFEAGEDMRVLTLKQIESYQARML
jgi:CDP-glucose 4,6-dehydratase